MAANPPEQGAVCVAVIGCGYWGPNLIRNFSALGRTDLKAVCDLDPEKLARVKGRYPAVDLHQDLGRLLDDPSIDAVAICTPVHTHFPIASAALKAGKHVLLEKPLTHSTETAQALVDLAA
ncbi:MAG: Gfo/Idh/MocA family oxidoreductase, partial [Deltaproteobacteria bacterium]|nr:Gfo/Idh/MocA family oxidoreductase [Deltaproteobacteria bacterium]